MSKTVEADRYPTNFKYQEKMSGLCCDITITCLSTTCLTEFRPMTIEKLTSLARVKLESADELSDDSRDQYI